MNEQPKSIWRKPWQGWRGALLWLALLAVAAFVVIYCIGFITGNDTDLLIAASVGSVCIALVIVLGILFIRWICCWRNFRRSLFGVACVVTIIALFYAEENWRGKHAWKKFKTEWEAKGEKFNIADIAPPPVPDDQNFAMTPIVASSYSFMLTRDGKLIPPERRDTNLVNRLVMPFDLQGNGQDLTFTNRVGNWQTAEKTDLKPLQEYYRKLATLTNFSPVTSQSQTPADAVLLALSRYESAIEELRVASRLPYSRFPLNYDNPNPAAILLPHLGVLKNLARTVQLRAVAELQSGQTGKAFDDIKLMFRLTESVHAEPILISQLVRIAILNIALQPIWEGLADHKWSDAQLAALGAEFGKLDFLADYQFGLRAERAMNLGIIDYMHRLRKPEDLFSTFEFDGPEFTSGLKFQMRLANVAPGGWFEQNKVACFRVNLRWLVPIVNIQTRIVSPEAEREATNACKNIRVTPVNWCAALLVPALSRSSDKCARAQSATDMARIAIALERYRLARGNFPETLDALAPQFMEKIPHDIIGGQPLKYRRDSNDQFILYSVGWNETDDGGKIALTKAGNVDPKQGDWVWRYPEK